MYAVAIYRALLLVRGCWLLLEWVFGWGSHGRVDGFTLLHPFASLLAHALGAAAFLVILAGLWFFRRWARLLFVILLVLAVGHSILRPSVSFSAPPSLAVAINLLVLIWTGAILAMSFLPPVRDMFATQT